jgi:hypothetical protein
MLFIPFPLKVDVLVVLFSRLVTLLSIKYGLGNPTNIFRVSVTRSVHRNSCNRRKPFLKSTPKTTTTIMGTKNWRYPILVIRTMRDVNQWSPRV